MEKVKTGKIGLLNKRKEQIKDLDEIDESVRYGIYREKKVKEQGIGKLATGISTLRKLRISSYNVTFCNLHANSIFYDARTTRATGEVVKESGYLYINR